MTGFGVNGYLTVAEVAMCRHNKLDHLCKACQEHIDALNDDGLADFLDEFVNDLYEEPEKSDAEVGNPSQDPQCQ